jgi:5-carboxymethyl-2-hydroxymuconate isomerase
MPFCCSNGACLSLQTCLQQVISALAIKTAVHLLLQVLQGRSHALLQETGVNIVDIMREEGFYVQRRVMSAPVQTRR